MEATTRAKFLLCTLLVTLTTTCWAEEDSQCVITEDDGFIHLQCTNVTDVASATAKLTTTDSRVGHLYLVSSPGLVLTRVNFDDPAYRNLQALSLLANNVTAFDPAPFRGLESLRALSIALNNITTINDDTFSGLDNLVDLFLLNNQIDTISSGAFKHLKNLTGVDLSGNRLTTLGPDVFSGLKKFHILHLNGNELTSVDQDTLGGADELHIVELAYNDITSIDSRTFQNNPKLREVTLAGNELVGLDVRLFESNPELKYLDLSWNNLENITNFPINSTSLLGLRLEFCNIQTIPVHYFSHLASLRFVHLANNRINSIETGLFSTVPNIRRIILAGNKLNSLSVETFSTVFYPILKELPQQDVNRTGPADRYGLALGDNPWDCSSQDLVELRAWTVTRQIAFDELFQCQAADTLTADTPQVARSPAGKRFHLFREG